MAELRSFVAGNWKMNGVRASLTEVDALLKRLSITGPLDVDVMICPPATLIDALAVRFSTTSMAVGAQDCHTEAAGAHTGDISPEMLTDAGASAVIVGHSERRADHGETDAIVRAKADAAYRAGLKAIICVGETEAERRVGSALDVVSNQLKSSLPQGASPDNTIIAYEPVWAIGTGSIPTPEDIAEVHAKIRAELIDALGDRNARAIRILYGGSVKPSNAAELLAIDNVNGALVGGASLKAHDFFGILSVYAKG